jgi:protein-L-isoaspartate(D-aspartate) O-methyltransferase
MPHAYVEQLAEGGLIAVPVGNYESQELIIGFKRDGKLKTETRTPCVFVPLIGEQGFKTAPKD